jgi:ABC-2 type transport system ATP-binding protein
MTNVNKKIKGAKILEDINLTLESGHIYGLRGKNGCGKTMLMRTLCGLVIPDSGEIEIDGEVLHKDIKFPKSVGALIENPSFLPQYSGLKNLTMLASLMEKVGESDVKYAISRTGLDVNDKRTYKKYSLGMKQKLGIANAIMGEPDIIILDEPINALDEESVVNIKEEFLKLRDKGKIIVVACHDREELEYLSDIIYVIKEGKIVNMEEIEK